MIWATRSTWPVFMFTRYMSLLGIGRGDPDGTVGDARPLGVLEQHRELQRPERLPLVGDVVAEQRVAVEVVHRVCDPGLRVDGDERVLVLGELDGIEESQVPRVVAGRDLMTLRVVRLFERHVHDVADHVDVADVDVPRARHVSGIAGLLRDQDVELLVGAHDDVGLGNRRQGAREDPAAADARDALVVEDGDRVLGSQHAPAVPAGRMPMPWAPATPPAPRPRSPDTPTESAHRVVADGCVASHPQNTSMVRHHPSRGDDRARPSSLVSLTLRRHRP